MTENILMAFNGQLDLRVAYTYTLNQIHDFLSDVVNQPGFYGISINQVSELVRIRAEIMRLSLPRGEEYDAAALRPRQHIHRAINPRWSSVPPARVSRFRLLRHRHNDVDFWSATDLLGLFLSSIGRAPLGATKRSFYLPLTAVYGKWCSKVCSTPPAFVVQCSWREAPGERPKFFLGASLAGHRASKATTGSWRHVLDRARYYIICSEPLKLAGWSPKRSPSLQAYGPTFGKPFGRGQQAPTQVYGLALCKWYLRATQYDDRLSGPIWGNLWNPCLNCQELIRTWKGDVNNFLQGYGAQGAPP
ncbi:hypothetical protein BDV39DRAFT_204590 [Aspergillus sergii]|uniref:Uncharacterized protein n=1 Tax=Aspergillus sergii TaxID=1034303 RepID=A0A5N6X3V7_9EURO|nr:hypothetical protein BDV39DRAFT_204590 [Aspergillus sergii]